MRAPYIVCSAANPVIPLAAVRCPGQVVKDSRAAAKDEDGAAEPGRTRHRTSPRVPRSSAGDGQADPGADREGDHDRHLENPAAHESGAGSGISPAQPNGPRHTSRRETRRHTTTHVNAR